MSKIKSDFNNISRYTKTHTDNFKRRIQRIEERNLTIEEKYEALLKISNKQQKFIEEMIEDQDALFTHVQAIKDYRELGMRGLAFVVSGHEMCGIFDRVKYIFKNTESLKHMQKDIDRLEEVLVGQFARVKPNMGGRSDISGKEIISHFDSLFKNRSKKTITYSNNFAEAVLRDHGATVLKNYAALTIISNVVHNAMYFSDEVEIKLVDDKIIISDNGDGVNEKDVNKLFNIGFTTKGSRGHGIGLYMCREMARESLCDLYFDKSNKYTELKGASFVFDLNPEE
ncbi:MAG: hypothetical protein CL760_05390 [Chloroflexi bacterium]|nr:hypothetical protein [Chloroflexota bacterium]|tara:strand:- start:36218 stop:37069 length:852 start_codon:yes stop_codon:yes gene_type:complete